MLVSKNAGWGVKWVSDSSLDGYRESLQGGVDIVRPAAFAGHTTMVFATRADARAYIKENWGYIAKRPDLRAEPHGWKMPRAVRVEVVVKAKEAA